MNQYRNKLIFYLTATCNLKCKYCFIDKSPCLIEIDKILSKSFENDYYFDFAKQIIESQKLTEIQFWGGEPSYGLPRFYKLLPKFIEYYPNLTDFFMSTNFTTQSFFSDFYDFLKILSNYPKRDFTFSLQLSIDGPKDINDINRGKGTTDKFLKNFKKLLQTIEENTPKNVHINIFFKQTLSIQNIHSLQTKDDIIKYFLFFDDLCEEYYYNNIINPHIKLIPSIPNTAAPSPVTKEDGIKFANFLRLSNEIQKENNINKIFKNYNNIIVYQENSNYQVKQNCIGCQGNCGSGYVILGLLPNEMISLCHNGFTNLLENYKKYAEQNNITRENVIIQDLFTNLDEAFPMCLPYQDYLKYEELSACFFDDEETFQYLNYVILVQTLAKFDQIEKKYEKYENALLAVDFILQNYPKCIKNNTLTTGTFAMPPDDFAKLLLNGGLTYVKL